MKSVKDILAEDFPPGRAIGILALQGAVQPHAEKLSALRVRATEVRTPYDLEKVQALILPGGESTTLIHLLKLNRLWDPLREFAKTKPMWGVCAGSILLAKEVQSPSQDSLGVLDIAVERNAYGRQLESFVTEALTPAPGLELGPLEGVFIRAPRIQRVGSGVRTLLSYKEEPVAVEYGLLMATTFHPELSAGTALHRYFLKKCGCG